MENLKIMTQNFPQTELWNDSCSVKELSYAIAHGAVGATTNPVIVGNVLKQELKDWEGDICEIIQTHPEMIEDEVAWEMIKRMGKKASALLLDQYQASNGRMGRISFQTNAKYYRDANRMVAHAKELAAICENSQIKAPASKAGIQAYEEMTFAGISINATVSFTVAQAIACAQAVERGLKRREEAGLSIVGMHPVCTIMAGRLDDHIKAVVNKEQRLLHPEALEWAGIAVVKEALALYEERGYRTKLLVAAFRNVHHWLSFIGEEIVLTIPYDWQKKINGAAFDVENAKGVPVDPAYLSQLHQLPEFEKAFYEDGLTLEEFEHYGPFVTAIGQFLTGYDELVKLIRSYMIERKEEAR